MDVVKIWPSMIEKTTAPDGARWSLTPILASIDRAQTEIHWIADVHARDFHARVVRVEGRSPTNDRVREIDAIVAGRSIAQTMDRLSLLDLYRINKEWYSSIFPPFSLGGADECILQVSDLVRILNCNQRHFNGFWPRQSGQKDYVWGTYAFLDRCPKDLFRSLIIQAIETGRLEASFCEPRKENHETAAILVDGRKVNVIRLDGEKTGVF